MQRMQMQQATQLRRQCGSTVSVSLMAFPLFPTPLAALSLPTSCGSSSASRCGYSYTKDTRRQQQWKQQVCGLAVVAASLLPLISTGGRQESFSSRTPHSEAGGTLITRCMKAHSQRRLSNGSTVTGRISLTQHTHMQTTLVFFSSVVWCVRLISLPLLSLVFLLCTSHICSRLPLFLLLLNRLLNSLETKATSSLFNSLFLR